MDIFKKGLEGYKDTVPSTLLKENEANKVATMALSFGSI